MSFHRRIPPNRIPNPPRTANLSPNPRPSFQNIPGNAYGILNLPTQALSGLLKALTNRR